MTRKFSSFARMVYEVKAEQNQASLAEVEAVYQQWKRSQPAESSTNAEPALPLEIAHSHDRFVKTEVKQEDVGVKPERTYGSPLYCTSLNDTAVQLEMHLRTNWREYTQHILDSRASARASKRMTVLKQPSPHNPNYFPVSAYELQHYSSADLYTMAIL